jgi:RHS repeat-associated protein
LLGIIITDQGATNTYYVITGENYNIARIVDGDGNTVENYHVAPFGEFKVYDSDGEEIQSSTIGNPYVFQGRQYDKETGLYYFRNRYYSPELQRFISRDPLGYDAGDINLYRFVGNNPYGGLDPMGQEVTGVFKKGTGTLTIWDENSQRGSVQFKKVFSGSEFSENLQDGPIPNGSYRIMDTPSYSKYAGYSTWFGLFKENDGIFNDWIDSGIGKSRFGLRLHLGNVSLGCVTIDANHNAPITWWHASNWIRGTRTSKSNEWNLTEFGSLKVVY